ncbi:rhodanese-like domain-containing protein [Alteromonas sp. ASW11-19]|uniref:Rhodanese-like domain-containing protein n=1 Tax=Alteromonas salexigens TaxID=2982530 RepID=A0ABT2VR95_9ALTE|nr:rhodanese-like domain-containing protein [Alteromonas salexigens]MCU7555847.1 rhodanese-like domain-containing protein [Alteromonas salexigens]
MLKTIQERLAAIEPPVRQISAQEAATEMQQNNGLVIDVRESAEREQHPVDASTGIPRGVLEMKITDHCKDPARPIYLHCASGVRAQLAAEQLRALGYQNVTAITCKPDAIKQALD